MARYYQSLTLLILLLCSPVLALDLNPDKDIRFAFQATPATPYEPKVSREVYGALQQAAELVRNNQNEKAAKSLALTLKRTPDPALWYGLAQIQQQQGKWHEARRSLLSAIKLMPDFRRAHQALGAVLTRTGNYNQARQHLLKAHPQSQLASHYRLLGYGYLRQEHFLAAQMAYQQALIHEADNANALQGLLQAAFGSGDLSLATSVAEELLRSDPNNPQLWQMKANIALQEEQWTNAVTALEIANRLKPSAEQELRLARLYLQQEQYSLAAPYLNRLAARPDQIEPGQLVEAGQFLLSRGQHTRVSKLVTKLLKISGLSPELNSELFYLRAQAALAEQDSVTSIRYFEKALTYNSQHGRTLLALARLKPAQSEALLTRASYIPDTSAEANVSLAQYLVEKGAYQRALTHLKAAQKKQPGNQTHRENIRIVERLIALR